MALGQKTGGRQAGVPNKVGAELKEMIMAALDDAGGVSYLVKQAVENPQAFMALLGKVLPLQAKIEHGGTVTLEQIVAGSRALVEQEN